MRSGVSPIIKSLKLMKMRYLSALWGVLFLLAPPLLAQDAPTVEGKNSTIQLSGLAYLDYFYVLAAPDEDLEGDNGFEYRRLYLTTDYTISEVFSGRARFEAKGGSASGEDILIKDMYLKAKNVLGEGSEVSLGVTSPPSFTVSEGVWGYRSLEKTILDRVRIVSSRDFGVLAKGRLTPTGSVRYGVMFANNNSTRGEDEDNYKRVYGQLEFYPSDQLAFTLGGDYAGGEEGDGFNVNAFGGYSGDQFRIGIEGFYNQISYDEVAAKQGEVLGEDSDDRLGVSLFGAARLAEEWEVVARFDQFERDNLGTETSQNYFLAGVAYQPHEQVRFIPNVVVVKDSDEDAFVTGRLTVHVDF